MSCEFKAKAQMTFKRKTIHEDFIIAVAGEKQEEEE